MPRSSRDKVITLAAGVALVAASAAPATALSGAPPSGVSAAVPAAVGEVVSWQSDKHTFGLDDVIGNSQGETDATNPNVIKDGDAGESLSPDSEPNIIAKDSGTLYPINSTFGFDVQDFVKAIPKTFDDVAEEGWAGTFTDDSGSGLQFSDADTASLKALNLVGTWAAGLGGNEIKASTEHFTVMEAVLSCAQTVPYNYWASLEDWEDGLPAVSAQRVDPNCLSNKLPDPTVDPIASALDDLIANEDNIIPDTADDPIKDLYLGTNYSVTEKDDGKVLYRWGQAVKRPTDIRFATTIPLPEEWGTVPAGEKGFKVTKAELVLKHAVTNNPNDQIRPEDWENEGATGRLPEYKVADDGTWVSTQNCYEGDGDFIPAGTVYRDPALGKGATAPSSDLAGGFSAAWYTTIDRDPFEWAYKTADGTIAGSHVPDSTLGELVSGPRWRMLSNKFGQDIPSLEIPALECDAPPYEKGTVKYEVGDVVETTINLLDWSTLPENARWLNTDDGSVDAQSPFAYSAGWTTTWTEQDAVPGQKILEEDSTRCDSGDPAEGSCVTDLGTKLTDGFDVAFYVKGDQKPLKVYDVFIRMEYEGGTVTTDTLDFGDAPATYGTADVRRNVGTAYLGDTVDAEAAPQAPLDGTGDDTNGTSADDEDGVTLPEGGFLPGMAADVDVTTTGGGTVTAWFDWNADGKFDPAEQVADGLAGPTLQVTPPLDAKAGTTYARFVLTADDYVGEVEDYAITVGGYDFGDAPSTYETDGGIADPAKHQVSGLSLKTVDTEAAPQSSAGADGDGTDDGDGVSLSKFVTNKSSTVKVTATEAGKLDAWIDWNADGKFDAAEQVADGRAVRAGTISFKVAVPTTAVLGLTYARFRVSGEGDLEPTGPALSGEVEDYVVTTTRK